VAQHKFYATILIKVITLLHKYTKHLLFGIVCGINLNRYRDKYLSTGLVDYDLDGMSSIIVLGMTISIMMCFVTMSTLLDHDGTEVQV